MLGIILDSTSLMAPGSSAFKEVVESHPKQMNHKTLKMKAGSGTVKTSMSLAEKHSIHGVHELLQCPTCADSMYPPIHQVFTLNSSSAVDFD